MIDQTSSTVTDPITSNSPEETFKLGERLGAALKAGDVILLNGGLGAGKTLLTKGMLHGLGYDEDEVTSPSFTLVNRYDVGDIQVYHIDLWRLEPGHDAGAAVGLDEILEDEASVAIIEWPDRLKYPVPAARILKIDITGSGNEPRSIVLTQS